MAEPIALTDEQRETLKLGQEFAKLQHSPAYQKQLEKLTEWVESAKNEYEAALLNPDCFPEIRNNYGVRYVERRKLRLQLEQWVDSIVSDAYELAAQLKGEDE
jgi:phosphotransacetylase